jgi:RNA recognition motif-containing protein
MPETTLEASSHRETATDAQHQSKTRDKKPIKISLTSFGGKVGSKTTSATPFTSWADEMEAQTPPSPLDTNKNDKILQEIMSEFDKGVSISATRHIDVGQQRRPTTNHSRMGGPRATTAVSKEDTSTNWRTTTTLREKTYDEKSRERTGSPLNYTMREEKDDSFSWRHTTATPASPPPSSSSSPSMTAVMEKIPNTPPYVAFVVNLPYQMERRELEEVFAPLEIMSLRIPSSYDGKSKGFAYVEFGSAEDLKKALRKHGTPIQGRPIRLDVATGPRESSYYNSSHHGPAVDSESGGEVSSQNWREQNRDVATSWRDVRAGSRRTNLPSSSYHQREGGEGIRQPYASSSRYVALERATMEAAVDPLEHSQNIERLSQDVTITTTPKERTNPFGAAQPIDARNVIERVEEKLKQQTEMMKLKYLEVDATENFSPSRSSPYYSKGHHVRETLESSTTETITPSSSEMKQVVSTITKVDSDKSTPESSSRFGRGTSRWGGSGSTRHNYHTSSSNMEGGHRISHQDQQGWERVGDVSAERTLAHKVRDITISSSSSSTHIESSPSTSLSKTKEVSDDGITTQNVFASLPLEGDDRNMDGSE